MGAIVHLFAFWYQNHMAAMQVAHIGGDTVIIIYHLSYTLEVGA